MNEQREAKYRAFLDLHNQSGTFLLPNAWDAGSARILTDLGFQALGTTSAGYAFSIGRQDSHAGLSRRGILDNARAIADATDLPVSADLEDGFDALPQVCAETISLAAECGLVGGTLEDATGDAEDPIFEFAHSVDRVAAAAEAARANHFCSDGAVGKLSLGSPGPERHDPAASGVFRCWRRCSLCPGAF